MPAALTPDEHFLANRLSDPLLRNRDIAETLAMIAHAKMSAASPALGAFIADAARPLVLRRQAAAAFAAVGADEAARRLLESWRASASPEARDLADLAMGDRAPLARWIADPRGHDEDVAGWIAVACLLGAMEALPGLESVIRDEKRVFDVRRNAAEAFRLLSVKCVDARDGLRGSRGEAGLALSELIDIAVG